MQIDLNLKKSIRVGIGDELAEQGKTNPEIVVLDADLSGSTKTSIFAKAFPERFFNVGIAEQNLITTSVGLALTGKIPFAASFAVFATGRAYDQIRNSVCYQDANVKIIGAHGGITVGEDGASHQALEDVSLMRVLPNMTVIAPADYEQARWAVRYAINHNGPVYIRSSRLDVPCIFNQGYNFADGEPIILKEGTDVSVFSYGDIISEAILAVNQLETKGISAELINVPIIKPLNKEAVIKSAKKTKLAVTVEDHSVIGGLGSAISEILSENMPIKHIRIGVNDEFGLSGKPKELLEHFKLDANSIVDRIIKLKNDSIKICN